MTKATLELRRIQSSTRVDDEHSVASPGSTNGRRPIDGGTAREWYFLALAHHALKQPDAARSAFKKARAWSEAQKAGRLKNPRYQGTLPVEFWLELSLLDAEVAPLLEK